MSFRKILKAIAQDGGEIQKLRMSNLNLNDEVCM